MKEICLKMDFNLEGVQFNRGIFSCSSKRLQIFSGEKTAILKGDSLELVAIKSKSGRLLASFETEEKGKSLKVEFSLSRTWEFNNAFVEIGADVEICGDFIRGLLEDKEKNEASKQPIDVCRSGNLENISDGNQPKNKNEDKTLSSGSIDEKKMKKIKEKRLKNISEDDRFVSEADDQKLSSGSKDETYVNEIGDKRFEIRSGSETLVNMIGDMRLSNYSRNEKSESVIKHDKLAGITFLSEIRDRKSANKIGFTKLQSGSIEKNLTRTSEGKLSFFTSRNQRHTNRFRGKISKFGFEGQRLATESKDENIVRVSENINLSTEKSLCESKSKKLGKDQITGASDSKQNFHYKSEDKTDYIKNTDMTSLALSSTQSPGSRDSISKSTFGSPILSPVDVPINPSSSEFSPSFSSFVPFRPFQPPEASFLARHESLAGQVDPKKSPSSWTRIFTGLFHRRNSQRKIVRGGTAGLQGVLQRVVEELGLKDPFAGGRFLRGGPRPVVPPRSERRYASFVFTTPNRPPRAELTQPEKWTEFLSLARRETRRVLTRHLESGTPRPGLAEDLCATMRRLVRARPGKEKLAEFARFCLGVFEQASQAMVAYLGEFLADRNNLVFSGEMICMLRFFSENSEDLRILFIVFFSFLLDLSNFTPEISTDPQAFLAKQKEYLLDFEPKISKKMVKLSDDPLCLVHAMVKNLAENVFERHTKACEDIDLFLLDFETVPQV